MTSNTLSFAAAVKCDQHTNDSSSSCQRADSSCGPHNIATAASNANIGPGTSSGVKLRAGHGDGLEGFCSDSGDSGGGCRNGHSSDSEDYTERDEDWCEQRIKLDKRKLDQILTDSSSPSDHKSTFLTQIMLDHQVRISVPGGVMKNGLRSKRDPYLKVSGKLLNVEAAKLTLIDRLGCKTSKVTLKVDIGHNEHSHIIGKSGHNIKAVMDRTKCHIHFPDSNRTNTEEKSNQVSIAGDIFGLEEARKTLRQMQQLEFSFEIPLTHQRVPLDLSSPIVQKIGQKYEINISVDKSPRVATSSSDMTTAGLLAPAAAAASIRVVLYTTKGLVSNTEKVKLGTQELIDFLTQNSTAKITVQTTIDISPQQQAFVFGKDHSNIQRIINKTGCNLSIADPNIPNLPIAEGETSSG